MSGARCVSAARRASGPNRYGARPSGRPLFRSTMARASRAVRVADNGPPEGGDFLNWATTLLRQARAVPPLSPRPAPRNWAGAAGPGPRPSASALGGPRSSLMTARRTTTTLLGESWPTCDTEAVRLARQPVNLNSGRAHAQPPRKSGGARRARIAFSCASTTLRLCD